MIKLIVLTLLCSCQNNFLFNVQFSAGKINAVVGVFKTQLLSDGEIYVCRAFR